MAHIAPQGDVYQAGTLSGNPVAMAAGIATLKRIKEPGFYDSLNEKADRLATGLKNAADSAGIKASIPRVGSMLSLFFTGNDVNNFDDAKTSDLNMFATYYKGMLEKGIYLPPSQFEVLFVSAAHDKKHIDITLSAAKEVFGTLSG
jgi:glutamate-1-semialdehyde 2,1-aminomutase